jgi:hypothetical protein
MLFASYLHMFRPFHQTFSLSNRLANWPNGRLFGPISQREDLAYGSEHIHAFKHTVPLLILRRRPGDIFVSGGFVALSDKPLVVDAHIHQS